MSREQFNKIYWAAQPPEVRALENLPRTSVEDAEARFSEAISLAISGETIDKQIHAEGLDPWATMWLRKRYGYTWVPSILQVPNFDLAPGTTGMPGKGYDPKNPMPGSITVSLEEADYPAWEQIPHPPAVIPEARPGEQLTLDIRAARAGETSPAGTVWIDEKGQKWVKMTVQVPFGWHIWWQRQSPSVVSGD